MAAGGESWSTQQLAEFLALVSSFTDEISATRGAVERAAEAVDAEVAAVIRGDTVAAAVGFPDGELPGDELVRLAAGPSDVELPGLGPCRVVAVPLDSDEPGQFLVARAGSEAFTREECDLLRGMARVLVLTVRMLHRQQLLERLSALQGMIVRRVDPREVLDAVVAGAAELIGDEVVGLRLVDPLEPKSMVLVSSVGVDAALLAQTKHDQVGVGASGRAIAEDRLVIIGDYSHADGANRVFAADDLQRAMAAPVRETGRIVGSLVVASRRTRRRYSVNEQDTLLAFAETASLALIDAKMVKDALDQAQATQAIIDASSEAFITMDKEGRIIGWNDQAESLLGWPRDEALGRLLVETIIPPELRARHRAGLERFLATGERAVIGSRVEVAALHRDGHQFPVELAVWSTYSGDTVMFSAFLHDITERKRAQDELAVARDQAVESSRLKSEFVANMSHEIRTPLNGVIGMSELLLDTELSDEQREYAEAVRASGDVLMAVIDDILDFSKIEAGKLELESEAFHVRHMVEGVCSIVAATAQAKGVELMSWVDDSLPRVLCGDGNRIRQVLANLMTNAVKFTAAGEVTVQVSGEQADGDKVTLRFEVVDTGIGIEQESLERIFDSFSQADGSTTRRYGGTGLGLAISRQLTGLMGGGIGVHSTAGEGSTFWFTVPLEVTHSHAAAPEQGTLSGIRVLVVDDNATNRTILERQLTSWGMTCQTAAGADTALTMLRAAERSGRPYSVVLLDALMPGMSGLQLARAIKAAPELRSARIVMMTSLGDRRQAAPNAGVDAFVTKPVRQGRLHEQIARVLGGRRPGDAVDDVPVTAFGSGTGWSAGRRVLVAEDNDVNQLVAIRLLEKRGFAVDVAATGREVLEIYESGRYAAIFMDCHMPELDGYEATREIRRREGSDRHTPIIAMTANTMKGDRERCLAAGMDDYLCKPLRPDALDDVIARALRLGEGEVSVGGSAPVDIQSAVGQDAHPLLDRSMLADVWEGDEQALGDLVALFLDQSRTKTAQLAQALAAGDGDMAQRLAHGLKGSSATVGAVRLAEIASRLCDAARTGELSDASQLYLELQQSLDATSAAFGFELPLGLSRPTIPDRQVMKH